MFHELPWINLEQEVHMSQFHSTSHFPEISCVRVSTSIGLVGAGRRYLWIVEAGQGGWPKIKIILSNLLAFTLQLTISRYQDALLHLCCLEQQREWAFSSSNI
jgi:hypothetical protein